MASAFRSPLSLFWRVLFLAFLLAWAGVVSVWQQWQVDAVAGEMRRELGEQSAALAQTLPPEMALWPQGNAVSSPALRRLAAGLTAYRQHLAYRSLYTLAQRDGQIVWGAVATDRGEPPVPGTLYDRPPAVLAVVANVFDHGEVLVHGPYRRGETLLISAFAPVVDPVTGTVRLVVGIDADGDHWQTVLRRARLGVWGRSGILLALIVLGFVLFWYRPFLTPRWQARLRYVEIYLVTAFGIALTLTLALTLQEVEARSQRQTFHHIAQAKAELIRQAFAEIRVILDTTAWFMAESPFVSRSEFRSFGAPLIRHAHLAALGWVPSVPVERRQAWEKRAHTEGITDFGIWEAGPDGQPTPAAPRKMYYPLWYMATAGEAVVGLGYDFASHPTARAALEKAMTDGLSTATAPLTLPGRARPTILIFRPVLSGRLLRGLIVAFVSADSFLTTVLEADLAIEPSATAALYRLETNRSPQMLMVAPSSARDLPLAPPGTAQATTALPKAVFPILAFDQVYVLDIRSRSRFLADYPRRAGPAALLIGALFTALVAGFTAVALRYRNELEVRVAVRTRELRYRESYLMALLDTMSDAVFTVQLPERRITYVNRRVYEVFGYQPEEVIGQTSRLFYPTEADFEAYGQALVAAQAQGQNRIHRELRLRRKDGHSFWAEVDTTFLDPREWPHMAITLVRDIHARKEAEARLRASEERYRLLFNSMLNGFVLYEVLYDEAGEPMDYRFLEVNPAFERLTGLLGTAIGGRTLREVLPDVEAEWLAHYAAAVRSGQSVHFDHYSRPLKRHYEVSAYCPQPGQLVSFFNDVTEREEAKERSEKQVQRLAALRTIDMATAGSFDLPTILDIVNRQVLTQLHADAVAVSLLEKDGIRIRYTAGRGLAARSLAPVRVDEGYLGRVVRERCIRGLNRADPDAAGDPRLAVLVAGQFACAYAAPLLAKGEVKGVLEVFARHPCEPDKDWFDFFETLAGQAAIAIDNAQLFAGLQRAHAELAAAYDATIEGWVRALDLRDRETEGHTRRVVAMTERLARAWGLSEAEIVHLRRGALLHDIGKMAVPDSILLKQDKLTPEEEAIMRRHPLYAYDLLAPIAYLRPALDIPRYHHERWDGSGYPYGLKGEQIPLAARLFAVVDVWDALRSNRPYRRAWSQEEAIAYLRAQRGILFDPRVVDVFLRMVAEMNEGPYTTG